MHDLFALLGTGDTILHEDTPRRRSYRGPKSTQERNEENTRKLNRKRQRDARKRNRP